MLREIVNRKCKNVIHVAIKCIGDQVHWRSSFSVAAIGVTVSTRRVSDRIQDWTLQRLPHRQDSSSAAHVVGRQFAGTLGNWTSFRRIVNGHKSTPARVVDLVAFCGLPQDFTKGESCV
jgi:hypothetical protein